ncbi:peptidase M19 [Sinimarinibacterium thermocellulolyticum]|uniref:Peptidase M19 n=1 Tax=Sinimarinibacterium thermocellulolyticum TaxID=3170016 RepID=A0ABV2AAD7_9GAMM
MRRSWMGMLCGATLALAACRDSDPPSGGPADPDPAGAPQNRYELANRCFTVKALDSGRFIARQGNGYAATATSADAAERFYMKPTALGDYLFHGRDGRLLASAGDAVVAAESASDAANWTIDTVAPGRYTVVLKSDGTSAPPLGDGAASGEFAFVPAQGCTPYPEISTDSRGETYKGRGIDQPVVGFAEVHTHMAMGHEMSDGSLDVGPSAGGVLYGQMYHRFGVPHALADCEAHHGPQGIQDPEALILDLTPLTTHDTVGWPDFIDWPAYDSQLHQAMYYKWVERAWKAGLRILVSEGTNIAALCEIAVIYATTINPQALGYDCNDMSLGIKQVKYLKSLQDYVDAQEGGPGKGWFRIVGDPAEARRVINEGKLAVVPGLEFSNIFDCTLRTVAGVGEVVGCTREDIDRQIDEIWELGVRELFPYHDVDSALGGTGIFNGDALNLVGFWGTGHFWRTYDCPDGGEGEAYFYDAGAYMTTAIPGTGGDPLSQIVLGALNGIVPLYPAGKRQCNARGMTELGRYVIEKLMEKKFIIDIDHAELSIKQDMIDIAKAQNPPYPLISAHGGHGGISIQQAKDILALGGLIYPFKPNGRGHVEFMRKLKPLWDEARPGEPLAVGYGMDANGIADRSPPRGATDKPVQYPFTLFQGEDWGPQFEGFAPLTFDLQTIPQSGKSWHIDEVGTAHYGMVADYVEEVRLEGGREALDALYWSAEAYLRMWEQVVNR